jgi:hypothetical protein
VSSVCSIISEGHIASIFRKIGLVQGDANVTQWMIICCLYTVSRFEENVVHHSYGREKTKSQKILYFLKERRQQAFSNNWSVSPKAI